jgi:hypothetical protein
MAIASKMSDQMLPNGTLARDQRPAGTADAAHWSLIFVIKNK